MEPTREELPRVELVDTTLRDGEQMPGVAFSSAQKGTLAGLLADAELAELEVGTPAMGKAAVAAIRAIVRRQLPCRLTAWCRATDGDLEAAAQANVSAVHISFPVSDLQLRLLHHDRRWLFQQIDRLVVRARRMFDFVSVGAQDASRTELHLLIESAQAVEAVGADRFRLADTVGVWSPPVVGQTVAAVRNATSRITLGFHAHNDLGMATANTVAAVLAGAGSADVTVLGIGERAGNAALEEVVMALRHAHQCDTRIRADRLMPLAAYVSRCARHPITANKPIVGANAFRHESGIHVRGLLCERTAYEPFSAQEIGVQSRMVLGKHSGTGALCHALAQCGIHLSSDTATRWLPRLRRLTDNRFLRRLLQQWEIPLS